MMILETCSSADPLFDEMTTLEGHFLVHAVNNGEVSRFIIESSNFAHPGLLKLFEQAEEEYGFSFTQEGVLSVPCGPNMV